MVTLQLDGFLSSGEVARRLGVSVTRVAQLRERGLLEGIRTKLGFLYPSSEVEKLKSERELKVQRLQKHGNDEPS